MRIDAHIHGFPDRLAAAVRGRLDRDGRLTAGYRLAEVAVGVKDQGFEGAWLLPYAHRAGVAESLNEWSAAEVRRYPWLVPGATFHPDDEGLAGIVQRALVELRLPVVKLHCSVGSFAPDDPRLAPLWEHAAALRVPVVIHAGRRGPGATEADELELLAPVLRAHPALTLVLAHTGLPACARALELMAAYPNLSADLTPVWDSPVPLTRADFLRFPGRFLFGSDAPNNPTPAARQAARLEELGLPPEERAAVLGGTAARLVPLDPVVSVGLPPRDG